MGIETPIIALTATNITQEVLDKHGHLFESFIIKPFRYTQLYRALRPFIEEVPFRKLIFLRKILMPGKI